MKKLILIVLAAVTLAACADDKIKPEYDTRPEITDLKYPAEVYAFDYVPVSAMVTSKYGIYSIVICYWVGDFAEDKVKYASGKIFENPPYEYNFSGTLPSGKAGVKISFQVICTTPYDVLGASEVITYVIKEGSGGEVPVE